MENTPDINHYNLNFEMSPEEAQKLYEATKQHMEEYGMTLSKTCKYLLPCGYCDKRNVKCVQYMVM